MVKPMVAFGDMNHVSFLWKPGFRSRLGTLPEIFENFKSDFTADSNKLFPALIIVRTTPLRRAILRHYAKLGYCTIVNNADEIRKRLPT